MKTQTTYLNLFIIFLLFIFSLQSNAQTTDTLQMPFVEHFTEGSLEINNWTTDCDNWAINTFTGQPIPCVRFNGQPFITGPYNRSLTSDWISLKETNGSIDIFIKFEYQGVSRNATSNETLYLEVFDSIEWHTAGEINSFSSSWEIKMYNISSYLSNEHFKIRFRASGKNSAELIYWAIDNLFVYENKPYPSNLRGNYYWEEDEFGIRIDWYDEQPLGFIPPVSWCDHFHFGAIGLSTEGDLTYAARWFDLEGWEDLDLYGIRYHLSDDVFDSLAIKIWRGQNGEILQYSNNITDEAVADSWNTHYLHPTIVLTDTSPTYVGFTIYGTVPGTYPASHDDGPAFAGLGDLVKIGEADTWDTLSNFGPDFNVNWDIILTYATPIAFRGFNIYRKEEGAEDYQLLEFLPEDGLYGDRSFFDKYPSVNIYNSYSYQVKDVYVKYNVSPMDTILSLPAYVTGTDDDFVTILVTRINEISNTDSPLLVYPNPATTKLNVKSKLPIKKISIFDLSGKLLWERNVADKHKIEIDVSSFKSGIYLIKVDNGVRVNSIKTVIQ